MCVIREATGDGQCGQQESKCGLRVRWMIRVGQLEKNLISVVNLMPYTVINGMYQGRTHSRNKGTESWREGEK